MKKLFYLVSLTLAFTTSVMAADLPCEQMSKDISFKSDKEMDQCVTQSDKVLNATYKHITSNKTLATDMKNMQLGLDQDARCAMQN